MANTMSIFKNPQDLTTSYQLSNTNINKIAQETQQDTVQIDTFACSNTILKDIINSR